MNLLRRLRIAAFSLILSCAVSPPAIAQEGGSAASDAWIQLYEPGVVEGMPYRLLRPLDYSPDRLYPVIVSLHGGGGRGTDNRRQLRVWNRLLADDARRSAHPSFVLAPQSTHLWDAEHLPKIKAVIADLPSVDMDRIYLLGHSMGGHGSFILLQLDPGYFAAAVPSAGAGRVETDPFIDASTIRDIPIWAFHGEKDTVAPFERAQALFDEMKVLDGNFKLTTWTGDGHSVAAKMITGGANGHTRCSSKRCDPEADMLEWLFQQSLDARR